MYENILYLYAMLAKDSAVLKRLDGIQARPTLRGRYNSVHIFVLRSTLCAIIIAVLRVYYIVRHIF